MLLPTTLCPTTDQIVISFVPTPLPNIAECDCAVASPFEIRPIETNLCCPLPEVVEPATPTIVPPAYAYSFNLDDMVHHKYCF